MASQLQRLLSGWYSPRKSLYYRRNRCSNLNTRSGLCRLQPPVGSTTLPLWAGAGTVEPNLTSMRCSTPPLDRDTHTLPRLLPPQETGGTITIITNTNTLHHTEEEAAAGAHRLNTRATSPPNSSLHITWELAAGCHTVGPTLSTTMALPDTTPTHSCQAAISSTQVTTVICSLLLLPPLPLPTPRSTVEVEALSRQRRGVEAAGCPSCLSV